MSLILAHRGASGYAPENTLPAFELAESMGADGFELDVHLSSDGHLVVIHDEKVDRTTNGSGYVKDMTLSEIKKLDASYGKESYRGARIPELSEVLELISGTSLTVNIEIKSDIIRYPGIEEKCLDLVQKMGLLGNIIFSSFNHYSVTRLRELSPEARLGLLYTDGLYQPWKYAASVKADYLHPYWPNLGFENYAEEAQKAGVGINAWTVNAVETMRFCHEKGVGIITNYPDIARKEALKKVME